MRSYLSVLKLRDYRLLWSGAVLSLLGDGASWTALSWIALLQGGAAALGVMSICYTFPVVIGGLFAGPLLDRFSRRTVLIADSLFRATVVLTVPAAGLLGQVHLWHVYIVAGMYGLLRIIPLGAVPAVVPDLVPAEKLQPAAALETIAFGVAGIGGPAIGGMLIPVIGAPRVLIVDACTFLAFALALSFIRTKFSRAAQPAAAADPEFLGYDRSGWGVYKGGVPVKSSGGWRPVMSMLRKDTALLAITAGFALFNCTGGMIRVTIPWLAHDALPGGARTLGLLLGMASGANLVGSLIAGTIKPADHQLRRIGILQILAGSSLFLLLIVKTPVIIAGLMLCNALSSPMTVSAQVVRLVRIPAELRGRSMTFIRTLMNGTLPLGSAIAAPLLGGGAYGPLVVIMALTAALPGVGMAVMFRRASFGKELGVAPAAEATPEVAPAEPGAA